jgi:hypothetical protein
MATFRPPLRDSASTYQDVYNNPDERFGIQNARVDRNLREQSLNSRPSEDGRRKRRRSLYPDNFKDTTNKKSKLIEERYHQENQPGVKRVISNTPIKVAGSVFTRSFGLTFGFFCWSATVFIAPVQAIFLMLGFTMMGIASQTEESWNAWLAEKAAALTGWIVGFEYPDLMSMATGSFLFAGFFGLSFLLLFAFTALILGLQPLNGKGADVKHSTFMLAILLSMVPFGSIPWIKAVVKNSK